MNKGFGRDYGSAKFGICGGCDKYEGACACACEDTGTCDCRWGDLCKDCY